MHIVVNVGLHFASKCLCMCECSHLCQVCESMHVFIHVCVCVSVCTFVRVSTHVYICLGIPVCIFTCACVQVCVYEHGVKKIGVFFNHFLPQNPRKNLSLKTRAHYSWLMKLGPLSHQDPLSASIS